MNRDDIDRILAAAETIEHAASSIESSYGLWRLADPDRKNLLQRLEAATARAEEAAVRLEDAAASALRAAERIQSAVEDPS